MDRISGGRAILSLANAEDAKSIAAMLGSGALPPMELESQDIY